ncbi:MAG: hypothetical protein M1832_004798 [Thelocarpon impressellum]|nr:MAG: hypothetical protein M1832_004798 [Thelocarpon impressellum]
MRFATLLPALLAAAPVAVSAIGTLGFSIPTHNPDGTCKTTRDYEADFDALKDHSRLVRGYDTSDCDFAKNILPACKSKGFKVILGIWPDVQKSWDSGLGALKEVAAKYGDGLGDTVYAVTVGSEALYRKSLTGDQLNKFIEETSKVVPKIKVGTADSWTSFVADSGLGDAVIKNSNTKILLVNGFPYWQGRRIDNATRTLFDSMGQAWSHIQGLSGSTDAIELMVGETGWPSDGDNYEDAEVSLENAAKYWKDSICSIRQLGVNVFSFEAFDEPNKPKSVGLDGKARDETHWGVFDKDRKVKAALASWSSPSSSPPEPTHDFPDAVDAKNTRPAPSVPVVTPPRPAPKPLRRHLALSPASSTSKPLLASSPSRARHQRTDTELYYTASWGSPYQQPPVALEVAPGKRHRRLRSISIDNLDASDPVRRLAFDQLHSAPLPHAHVPERRPSRRDRQSSLDALLPSAVAPGSRESRGRATRGFTEAWIRKHLSGNSNSERGAWWSDDSAGESPGHHLAQDTLSDDEQGGWLDADSEPSDETTRTPTLGRLLERGDLIESSPAGSDLKGRTRCSSASSETIKKENISRPHQGTLGTKPRPGGMLVSKWADPPAQQKEDLPPVQPSAASTPEPAATSPSPAGEKPLPPPPLAERTNDSSGPKPKPTPPSLATHVSRKPSISRAASAQSPRKRVIWRGKACIIALPSNDGRGAPGGTPRPLSPEEIRQRQKAWEDKGFDVRGFGYWGPREVADGGEGTGQSRLIYPEPGYWKQDLDKVGYRVSIPDRREWEAYVQQVKEEKLRALGVSFGDDPAPAAVSPTPSSMSRQASLMSRQASSQHPPLALSPPLPTSSAASNLTPLNASAFSPFGPGHSTNPSSHVASIGSPGPSHHSTTSVFAPRQSVSLPVGEQRFGSPYQLVPAPTPPLQAMSRGPSPAKLSTVPNIGAVFSMGPTFVPGGTILPGGDLNQAGQQQNPPQRHRLPGYGDARASPLSHNFARVGATADRETLREKAVHVAANQAELVTPIPRGHRHNLSESLQKEIDDAEYHLEEAIQRQLDADDGFRTNPTSPFDTGDMVVDPAVAAGVKGIGREQSRSAFGVGDISPRKPDDASANKETQSRQSIGDRSAIESTRTIPLHHPQPHSKTHSLSQKEYAGDFARKPTTSKLNVAAKEFKFDPTTSFTPGNFSFESSAVKASAPVPLPIFKARQPSPPSRLRSDSSTGAGTSLNVRAPEFKPGAAASLAFPSGDFNFSSAGPSFRPNAPSFTPLSADASHPHAKDASGVSQVDEAKPPSTKIFSFGPVIKPPKESNAVPIIRPDAVNPAGAMHQDQDGQEDESGRITQADARHKRMRRGGDDGDDVPQFATPTHPLIAVAQSGPAEVASPQIKSPDASIVDISAGSDAKLENLFSSSPASRRGENLDSAAASLPSAEPSPLTGLAKAPDAAGEPPSLVIADAGDSDKDMLELLALKADLAALESRPSSGSRRAVTGGIAEAASPSVADFEANTSVSALKKADVLGSPNSADVAPRPRSTVPSKSPSPVPNAKSPTIPTLPPVSGGESLVHEASTPPVVGQTDSSMEEVFRGADVEPGERAVVAPIRDDAPTKALIPGLDLLTPSQVLQPREYNRSGGPSPSPNRGKQTFKAVFAKKQGPSSASSGGEFGLGHGSPVHRLNTPGQIAASDWDDVVSPSEEHKLQSRSRFFDHRVDNLVGGLLESRIRPLEKTLKTMQESLALIASDRTSGRAGRRSASAELADSDADDEDDDEIKPRSRSPRQDRKLERIRNVVLEALASQQASLPTPAQSIDRLPESESARDQARLGEFRAMVEEIVGKQLSPRINGGTDVEQNVAALEARLVVANTQIDGEANVRRHAEERLLETQAWLRLAQEDGERLRGSCEEKGRQLREGEEKWHQELVQAQMRSALLEGAQENLKTKASELSAKNAELRSNLQEARAAEEKRRAEAQGLAVENAEIKRTMDGVKMQMEESIRVREGVRGRFDSMQEDMAAASRDFAREQAQWRKKDEEHRVRQEVTGARLEAEARTRERLEREIERLEAQELEAMRLRVQVEQTQSANAQLIENAKTLRQENMDLQRTATRYEAEVKEAREAARFEVHRTRTLMEADVEGANNQVNIVRANLESEVERVRGDLNYCKLEVSAAKAASGRALEEASQSKAEALRQVEKTHQDAMETQRQRYERHLDDLKAQHDRDLNNALEDKQRAETHLLERLGLSNAKTEHLQDKVAHIEEKLGIAKSAAQAAIQAAQARKGAPNGSALSGEKASARGSELPEKVSPQALRESILVLQEQLQEREGRIEKLEQELSAVDTDAPNKIKDRDTEIAWLRELLGVRIGDLEDIINTLSQEDYDGDAVKDAAIRLKANLQMEQQERERAVAGGQTFPSLASISSFASPKAVLPLAAAWGSWRRGRDVSSGNLSDITGGGVQTPSKSSPSAQSFLSGLLTPPNTTRQTPQQGSGVSQARGRQPSRLDRESRPLPSLQTPRRQEKQAAGPEPATPPLMRKGSYDQDAESGSFGTSGFYDDDESTVDGNVGSSGDARAVGPFGPQIGL